jgi:hypothetical protein
VDAALPDDAAAVVVVITVAIMVGPAGPTDVVGVTVAAGAANVVLAFSHIQTPLLKRSHVVPAGQNMPPVQQVEVAGMQDHRSPLGQHIESVVVQVTGWEPERDIMMLDAFLVIPRTQGLTISDTDFSASGSEEADLGSERVAGGHKKEGRDFEGHCNDVCRVVVDTKQDNESNIRAGCNGLNRMPRRIFGDRKLRKTGK